MQVKVPTDLPTSTLNRISEVIETQRGYLKGLGEYISSILSVSGTLSGYYVT